MRKIYLFVVFTLISLSSFAQWGQVNNGIANLSSGAKLLGSSDTHLFAGTLGGAKMYKTNDFGTNWTEIQPPVAGNVPECGFYFSGRYFAGLNSSMDCIYYTTNNGTSWSPVTGAPATTVVRGFISLSGNIFAYTSSKGIYKSTDGGANWSIANSGLTNLNVIWMETINSKLVAATIGGGVYTSSDNGTNWAQSNNGIGGGDLNATLVWRMGSKLYYIDQGGSSYSSTTEGVSWTAWTKPAFMGLGVIEVYRSGANLYLESRHFAGGLKDSLYITTNEGVSWTNITANLPASDLNASGIHEFGGFAFIAYNLISPNKGIYRRITLVGIDESPSADLLRIYPNPFTDKLALSNQSNKKVKQTEVYDSQGKLVFSGNGDVNSINTEVLTSGMYIIKIIFDDNTVIRRKLIKGSTYR